MPKISLPDDDDIDTVLYHAYLDHPDTSYNRTRVWLTYSDRVHLDASILHEATVRLDDYCERWQIEYDQPEVLSVTVANAHNRVIALVAERLHVEPQDVVRGLIATFLMTYTYDVGTQPDDDE